VQDRSPSRVTLAVVAAAWLGACTTLAAVNREIDALLAEGRYDQAVNLLESQEGLYGERNALLYELERGMLLHLAGDYEASNEAFERAKQLADAYYTKSVTQGLSSWAVNDRAIDYYGQNFERAMIHIFAAINYAAMGRRDEALVEARQLDHLLTSFKVQYGDRYTYREDAFGRYLSGMLYESARDWDDAYIAYWKALEGYAYYEKVYGVAVPASLPRAAARTARKLGPEKSLELQERWGASEPATAWNPIAALGRRIRGDVVIVHYNGRAPRKVEQILDISFGKGWAYVNATSTEGIPEEDVETAVAVAASIPASDTIRVSLPAYRDVGYAITRVEARVDTAQRVEPAERVQDIGAIARLDLRDRLPWIRAKAIARAAIKYALAKSVSEAGRRQRDENAGLALELTGAFLRAYAVLSERADTRAWSAIPDEIWMVKAYSVLPGERQVDLTFLDADGEVVVRRSATVDVKPGAQAFVIVRTTQ
jgi:tetratricopeptide (TPR) repeat protein